MIAANSSSFHRLGYCLIALLPFLQLGDYVVQRYFPAVVAMCIFSFLFFLNKIKTPKIKLDKKLYYAVCLYAPLLLLPFLTSQTFEEFTFNFFKVALPLLLFVFYYIVLGALSLPQRLYFLNLSVCVSILVGVVESYLRLFSFESISETLMENFYLLKFDSPFFADSNAAAVYYLVLLATLLGLNARNNKIIRYQILILSILVVLTLSRAAIAAMVVVFFIKWLFKRGALAKVFIYPLILIFILAAIPLIYGSLMSDGSGSTKIIAYEVLFNKLTDGSVHLMGVLFGVGINEGSLLYGYADGKFSHALLPMLIGQVGLLGSIFYFGFFGVLLLYSYKNVVYLVVAIFTAGLSYIHPFYEFIFAMAGILLAFSNPSVKNKDKKLET